MRVKLKKNNAIRLMRSNAKMVRWLCIITPEDRNSTGKPRNEMGMNLGNGYIIENLGGLVI